MVCELYLNKAIIKKKKGGGKQKNLYSTDRGTNRSIEKMANSE